MNADALVRALTHYGDDVILRRLTGIQRVPFDVPCRVSVNIGAAQALVGGVQITADRILMSSREIQAAGWPGFPRHGDQVVYDDGRTFVVQGRANPAPLDDGDFLIQLTVLGG
jgi:hypothetical protein